MTQVSDTYELSPMQAGMLYDAVSGGGPGVNVVQITAMLPEALDEAAFVRAWQMVAERHPVLRSRFRWEGVADPVQDVFDRVEIPVQRFDWQALSESERQQRFQALLDNDRIRGIDLSLSPLMRLTFVRASENEYWMLWTYHHAVLDGRARLLLLREVFAFYEAFMQRGDAALPVPRPYRAYIEWLRSLDHRAAKPYWQRALAGFRAPTPLFVARDRESADVTGSDFGWLEIRLSLALTTALRERAREASVTLNTLVQGAWALLLHRYSGETDIVFGATRACRRSVLGGADDMVGLFLNTLPLRVQVAPDAGLVTWLQQLRAQQVALRDYEHTPLAEIQGWSEVPRGLPVLDTILVFENQTLDSRMRAFGRAWSNRRFRVRGQANLPLVLNAWGDDELVLQLDYLRRRFADDVVTRMLGHLHTLLEGMAAHPQARLSDLPYLTTAERHQLLVEWNATAVGYPAGVLVHELFEQQVDRAPERTALRVGATVLSYGELETRATRLAQVLRSRGVCRGQRVGLCVERGADMLAAVLGILKAGGAYVPLDPSFPEERLRFMAEDARLSVLVSSTALASSFGLPHECQLLLDADAGTIASAPHTRLPKDVHSAQPDDPAYVIYTSGSTGKPKGVVVPHRAVVNFLTSMAREPGMSADDVLVAVTTLSFDIAVLELQLPLTLGATVVLASRDEAIDGRALSSLVNKHGATVMQATPATWRLLLEAGWSGRTGFKALVGGEALPKELAEQLIARGVELWNLYGPTETTVWSTCARITDTANGITIGKPIANTTIRVLDAHRNLCPIGVPGELCIGGDGLALGYWNRPELTAERFIPDPFSTTAGATLYRTGDRARWRNDGTLEHLGRLDFQVKLRGYRIELGEIEAGIARHPSIREVVVIAREDTAGDKRLVAYVVAENAPAELADQLRALIRTSLPEYMVPAHFVCLDALPLTPNGKVDRKSLPNPNDSDRAIGPSAYVAPRNDLEISLARAWERVLGVERVGITDSFFDLGGNSLSAFKLVFEMEQTTGFEIGLGDVFRSPTIAGLVTSLGPDATKNTSVVVPLQPEGNGIPVFCLCGINIYKDFAESLGTGQPVFGVYVAEEQALVTQILSGVDPDISIERLTEEYDKAIARFRPHGPYRLAGISFGGVLAVEIASRMRKRGAEVDLVILLDTILPQGVHRNWTKWIASQATKLVNGNAAQVLRGVSGKLRGKLVRHWRPSGRQYRDVNIGEAAAIRGVAFFQAIKKWKAREIVSDFRVILFRGSERSSLRQHMEFDDDYGWRRYLRGEFSTVDVVGGHLSIIQSPHVAELGRKAQQYLASVPEG